MRVLVITNDSSVFLRKGLCSAEDMFGGRVREVRNFCRRLSAVCDVSLGIISGRFGFVPGSYTIMPYDEITDTPEAYVELQRRRDYALNINMASRIFDRTIVFVPKVMMAVLLDNNAFPGKVIAVTDGMFREHFEERGWSWYARSGARIGKDNADRIFKEVKGIAERLPKDRKVISGASPGPLL